VLFAVLLPGGKLRPRHLVGALLGLTGTALILLGRGGALSGAGSPLGYASAFAAAFVWSGYSVTNRRVSAVPSDVIAGICGLVAIAGAITHFAVERTIVPDVVQALAIIGLGLGPVGLAFFVWDAATKHGDIALLGTLSYGAPLFSTLLLIAAGMAPASVTILGAAALIVGGAAISVGFSRRKADRRPSRQPAARPDGHAPPRGMR
jgi:drug/metabolite transporter (DMT)-like permease